MFQERKYISKNSNNGYYRTQQFKKNMMWHNSIRVSFSYEENTTQYVRMLYANMLHLPLDNACFMMYILFISV